MLRPVPSLEAKQRRTIITLRSEIGDLQAQSAYRLARLEECVRARLDAEKLTQELLTQIATLELQLAEADRRIGFWREKTLAELRPAADVPYAKKE